MHMASDGEVELYRQAQDLTFDAWEQPTVAETVAFLRRALDVYPHTADALIGLGEFAAETPEEEHRYYAQAVKAGKHVLGLLQLESIPDLPYWLELDTRPYMRAVMNLALSDWDLGRRKQALAGLERLLTLDPEDHVGARMFLLHYLIAENHPRKFDKWASAYHDAGDVGTCYALALAQWLCGGPSQPALAAMWNAFRANRHVPKYLLGVARLPRTKPVMRLMFGDSEAVWYVQEFGSVWKAFQPHYKRWICECLTFPFDARFGAMVDEDMEGAALADPLAEMVGLEDNDPAWNLDLDLLGEDDDDEGDDEPEA